MKEGDYFIVVKTVESRFNYLIGEVGKIIEFNTNASDTYPIVTELLSGKSENLYCKEEIKILSKEEYPEYYI